MKRGSEFFILVFGLCISLSVVCVLVFSFGVAAVSGESVGTHENVEMHLLAGGEDVSWRTLHGFHLTESGFMVQQEFNVIVCEDAKWSKQDERFLPFGFVFGELRSIHADDPGSYSITVAQNDFDELKDDPLNLSVCVLGEYRRMTAEGDELRSAYSRITLQRPNSPPVPVIMINRSRDDFDKDVENVGMINTSNASDTIFRVEIPVPYKHVMCHVMLDSTSTWDPDGDLIYENRWDLDGGGIMGENVWEWRRTAGLDLLPGQYNITYKVSDGFQWSNTVTILLVILEDSYGLLDPDAPKPDIAITDIGFGNINGEKNMSKGDRGTIFVYIRQLGEEFEWDHLKVVLEYWYHEDESGEEWHIFEDIMVEQTSVIHPLKILTIPWDTGISDFLPGTYTFRGRLLLPPGAPDGNISNNIFPVNSTDYDGTTVDLFGSEITGNPVIRIVDIMVSSQYALVNEIVRINITLQNTGDASARYVDIYYFINNMMVYFKTIEELGVLYGRETTEFVFSPGSRGMFDIRFEVRDDGLMVHHSEPISICCPPCGCTIPPPEPDPYPPVTVTGITEPEPYPTLSFVISLCISLFMLWGVFIIYSRQSSQAYWTAKDIEFEIQRVKDRYKDDPDPLIPDRPDDDADRRIHLDDIDD